MQGLNLSRHLERHLGEDESILAPTDYRMGDEFYGLLVAVHTTLDDEQAEQVNDICQYVLKAHQRHTLGLPGAVTRRDGSTIFQYRWDLRDSRRTEPEAHVLDVLDDISLYIYEGTPVRTTNRSGPVGSRAVEGLGVTANTYLVTEIKGWNYAVELFDADDRGPVTVTLNSKKRLPARGTYYVSSETQER